MSRRRITVPPPYFGLKASAPLVNTRYRRRIAEKVSWKEILVACGYEIAQRSLPTHKKMAAWRPGLKGGSYYIHCTYHLEAIASMRFYPVQFKCFGCGASGDKVDFVARVMHLRSAQAIKHFFTETFPQMCKE